MKRYGVMLMAIFGLLLCEVYSIDGSAEDQSRSNISLESSPVGNASVASSDQVIDITRYNPYDNQTHGFKINYPVDWIVKEQSPNENGIVVAFFPSDDSPDSIAVSVLPVSSSSTLESFGQEVERDLKKYVEYFNLEPDEKTNLSPGQGQLTYTGTIDGSARKVWMIYTLKDSSVFLITYDALFEDFNENIRYIQTMIDSFVLI